VIPAPRAHLPVAARTHPGMSGKNNEDRYAVSAHRLSEADPTPSLFAIVSDGVGGHQAGEVAAGMAVDIISQTVSESDGLRPLHALEMGIVKASNAIYNQSNSDLAKKGMGSTCACVWVIGDRLYTASVGDSRIYLLRDGELHQLSIDHTWVQEALDKGIMTPQQARGHPRANIIRRYLGSKNPVVPDFRLRLDPNQDDRSAESNQGTRLGSNDRLLLCSDGLTDLVKDGEIAAILGDNQLDEALDQLIDLANQRGGHDNITLVGLEAPPDLLGNSYKKRETLSSRPAFSRLTCIGISVLALVVLSILAGLIWWQNLPREATTPTLTRTVSGLQEALPPLPSPTEMPTTPSYGSSTTATPTPLSNSTSATYTPWPTNPIETQE